MTQQALSRNDVLAYLKMTDPAIAALLEKDMTVADVHQTTALGNQKPPTKAKTFKEVIEGDDDADDPVKVTDPIDKAWSVPLKILKAEPDKQMIFGWASVVEKDGKLIIDKQNDVILPEDLEEAAYKFVLYGRQQGDMHQKIGTGRLVESMIFTKEKQSVLKIDLGLVGWWVGFKVDDPELWEAHKRGERPEFSIGGRGRRVELT